MDKKLTVKIQRVGNAKEDKTLSYSVPLVVEHEDAVSARRGSLYSVIDTSAPALFDPSLVRKIVIDTIQNEYFANPEGTPLQCIEAAITKVREKVLNLLQDPKAPPNLPSEFHAVLSVLWGSVLYVVQYGYGCSYLIREGKIKTINTLSEGDFSIASGMVRSGDIVILGSRLFCENNTPENLLKGLTSDSKGAALILKFSVDKSEDQLESLDIKDSSASRGKPLRVNRRTFFAGRKKALGGLAVVAGVVFLISVSYALKANNITFRENSVNTVLNKAKENLANADGLAGVDDVKAREILVENKRLLDEAKKTMQSEELEKLILQNAESLDKINKVVRVSQDPVYDTKVDDQESAPSEIAYAGKDKVLVVDSGRNKFYKISLAPAASLKILESTQAASPKALTPTDSGVSFAGKDSFYAYDSGSDTFSKIESKYTFPLSSSLATTYLGNFYVALGNQILKNNILWTSDEMLKEGVSMAIDGSIYVLLKDGKVAKYTAGTREGFELKGLDTPISEAGQLYTAYDIPELYILDRGLSRVLVFSKEGVLAKQYVFSWGTRQIKNLKSISVSKDSRELYVLADSKIYKIPLE